MQWDNKSPAALHFGLPEIASRIYGQNQTVAQALLQNAHNNAFHYISIPLTNDNWKTRWNYMCLNEGKDEKEALEVERKAELWRMGPGFLKDEVIVTRLDETGSVIGLVSDWLELDSPDGNIRRDSEIALLQEISYASYLSIYTAILPAPKNREQVGSYARAVNAALAATNDIQLSIKLSLSAGADNAWELWDAIRTTCSYNHRLSLTLDFSPSYTFTPEAFSRWVAEPTRNIFIPANAFMSNPKGFPVLPKAFQTFIREIVTQKPTFILSGIYSGAHTAGGDGAYLQYIRHLEKTSPGVLAAETEGSVENFARGYMDYLQAPLQPLMDNLQSITYEMFEKDPVKYAQYEEAVFQALRDRPVGSHTVICVVGAGRGPLVAGCLRAMKRAGRLAKLYAVEKNPNAFVTLQERKQREWRDSVELFYGDMRSVDLPEKVDILVSELLGSFGDNELSPECLDGAERLLADDSISIPSSYTAYLAPLQSSKLHNEINTGDNVLKGMETPYVVMFHAVNILSGDPQPGSSLKRCGGKIQKAWDFIHPRRLNVLDAKGLPLTNTHNVRSANLNFYIPQAGILHGFAGYFESILYNDVCLSIHPDTKDLLSPNMLSWFPLFFPLREPLYLPAQSELRVSIWRLTDKRKVWYEWSAESFLPLALTTASVSAVVGEEEDTIVEEKTTEETMTSIKIGQSSLHNPGGRSSWIGL
ncbi:hypothetical protein M422DRAFT_65066 [Sphaerobolus stellatus SS14]|nr:hypothetical protein M422DRAFT_65066 [Sphaerobolus stellatus SS14]